LPFDVRDGVRFGAHEGESNSAVVSAASRSGRRNDSSGTRLGRIRPFGDHATSTGDGSTFFASNAAAATRCDARSNPACGDLASDDCASGFDAVARLGRRRTSTVNEGTARLNVALDTAHRSADSSRRRQACDAKRNKAIGDYRGNKRASIARRASHPVGNGQFLLLSFCWHWGRRQVDVRDRWPCRVYPGRENPRKGETPSGKRRAEGRRLPECVKTARSKQVVRRRFNPSGQCRACR
jgi:hypothetical protein